MTRAEIKNSAKDTLRGRWGTIIGILIVYAVVVWFIGVISAKIPAIGSIISLIVSVPLAYGLTSQVMKFSRKEETSLLGAIKEGYSNFGRSWAVVGRTIQKVWIYFLVYAVALILSGILLGVSLANKNSGLSAVSMILGIVGLVAAVLLAINSLYYIMAEYIAIDNPNLTPLEAVEESKRIMTNHRWEYFVLELSFIGWCMLAGITMGVGMIWLAPYMLVTMVKYYEYLSGNTRVVNETAEEVQDEVTVEGLDAETTSTQDSDDDVIKGM